MHSKGTKYCVEGGRLSKAPKFCRSQNEALKAADPQRPPPRPKSNRCVKRRRIRKRPSEPPKARGIGAEMSGRRKGGAGQSGQLCRGGKAREAANCSGKPGAPQAGRAPGKKFGKKKTAGKLRRRLKMNGFICFVRPAFSGRRLSGRRRCFAERGRTWQTPS